MNDEQLERYSRHILLPQMGREGQQRIVDASVLVIGVGGLGSPIAMYLAASGVGELTLVDFDRVELSNLQRQIVHNTSGVDENKVGLCETHRRAIEPPNEVRTIPTALDGDEMRAEVERATVVVDASDNFETRFGLNDVCVETGTPLVSGAAVRMEGQVTVFEPGRPDSPCYRCLYPDDSFEGEACSMVGVLAPILGIIGSVQAVETLKLLAGFGDTMTGRLLLSWLFHGVAQRALEAGNPKCRLLRGSALAG